MCYLAKHKTCRRLLFFLGGVVPLNTFAADGLGFPGANAVVFSVFVSCAILLLGFLILLKRMRKRLSNTARALAEYETSLRLMNDNLTDFTVFELACLPDGSFSFRRLGKGCEQVLGLDRDQTKDDAKLAFERLYEADIPILRETFRRALESPDPANLEIRALDASGKPRWLRISAVPHLESGTLVWNGFVLDITDCKNTGDALAEETRNFQNLFETIDDLLLVWDLDGNLLHTNRAVGRRLGYAYGELGDMGLFDLYPEPLRAEARQLMALMETEQTTTCNLPLLQKDGETIPAEMNVFQGLWKNKKAFFGVVRDVANRQQAETALLESQKMMQLIMNTVPLSIFWKDKDSVYLGCNKAFVRECGCATFGDVIGKTPADLFDAETAKSLIDCDQRIIAANQPLFNALQPHSLPDGGMGWRETNKIPLHDEEGRAIGILGVWRDVTEQNHAERRLKNTLEDMERFNQLMRGRERRTLELKGEINRLLQKLGQPAKYQTATDKQA